MKIDHKDKNGDTIFHVCAERNSAGSFHTIFQFYNDKVKLATEEEEKAKIKDEIKQALNIQNCDGNTILHLCAAFDR